MSKENGDYDLKRKKEAHRADTCAKHIKNIRNNSGRVWYKILVRYERGLEEVKVYNPIPQFCNEIIKTDY